VAVVGRDVLHDIVGGGAQDVLGAVRLMLWDAGRADVLFENLTASATCSIRVAKGARRSAIRSRPSKSSSGPAARMIGLALGATRSSTLSVGPCGPV
jgi:hypothetical protein